MLVDCCCGCCHAFRCFGKNGWALTVVAIGLLLLLLLLLFESFEMVDGLVVSVGTVDVVG